jgi:putrescine aminotransferase
MRHYWHPFADMYRVSQAEELMITRGQGVHVFDRDGNRYLDATASLWYCNVGYGRDEITEAVASQMSRLPAYSTFGDITNPPVLELSERLAALSPIPDGIVFLTSGGSDAIDTAVKLVRRYWQLNNQPNRNVLIGRNLGYHGMNVGATSLQGIEVNRSGYGDLLPGTLHVDWRSAERLEELIRTVGADRIAAFFAEPVMGGGGVWAAESGYLETCRRICRESDILFVCDEVITAFGRTGDWFASARLALEPDIIVFAKGVTSGYLPLGGLIVSREVAAPFWNSEAAGMWRHGYTYSGHATVAAAALANLDIIDREHLAPRGLRLEHELAAALRPLEAVSIVEEIRSGFGVMAAIQILPEAMKDPTLPDRIISALREAGIMTRFLVGGAIQISPPLTLQAEDLEELVTGLTQGLNRVAEEGVAVA